MPSLPPHINMSARRYGTTTEDLYENQVQLLIFPSKPALNLRAAVACPYEAAVCLLCCVLLRPGGETAVEAQPSLHPSSHYLPCFVSWSLSAAAQDTHKEAIYTLNMHVFRLEGNPYRHGGEHANSIEKNPPSGWDSNHGPYCCCEATVQ